MIDNENLSLVNEVPREKKEYLAPKIIILEHTQVDGGVGSLNENSSGALTGSIHS